MGSFSEDTKYELVPQNHQNFATIVFLESYILQLNFVFKTFCNKKWYLTVGNKTPHTHTYTHKFGFTQESTSLCYDTI